MDWKNIVAFLVDVLATFFTALSLILMKQSHHSVEGINSVEGQK